MSALVTLAATSADPPSMEARRAYTEDVRESLAASLAIYQDPSDPLRVFHSALAHPDGVRLLQLDASIESARGVVGPMNSFLSCLLQVLASFMQRGLHRIPQHNQANVVVQTAPLTATELIQLMRSVNENIRLNGFHLHGPPQVRAGWAIILQCMIPFEHERSLIPSMVELVDLLLHQPVDRSASASIAHPMAEADPKILFRLFQQNSRLDATLLPMVLLLRAHGANVNHITARGARVWDAISFRLTAGKIDFLLRWLLAEADLSVFRRRRRRRPSAVRISQDACEAESGESHAATNVW
jgi:hypothetical protein